MHLPSLTTHTLTGDCLFLVGRLAEEHRWNGPLFEAVWGLHPNAKHRIMIHGREVETPRWQQAFGQDYHYTGRVNEALPVPEILAPLLLWAQAGIDARLNGVLLNWYEGPGHYIGQHHDSTKNMVRGAPIVTVSFGETRTFRLTREEKRDKKWVVVETKDFPAPHGTLFVTPYATNEVWKHGVPKSALYTGRRISVTFRAFDASGVAGAVKRPSRSAVTTS